MVPRHRPKMGASMKAKSRINLKLLIDSRGQRVLFAEAGKDFVDFLFTLMSLPVGTVINLLSSNAMVGSLGKLYQSIENLDDTLVQPNVDKETLLNPKPPALNGANPIPLLLPNNNIRYEHEGKNINVFPQINNHNTFGFAVSPSSSTSLVGSLSSSPSLFGSSASSAFGSSSSSPCFGSSTSSPPCFGSSLSSSAPSFGSSSSPPCFGSSLSSPSLFGSPSSSPFGSSSLAPSFGSLSSSPSLFGRKSSSSCGCGEGGFVKGVVNYMVMDDLEVSPMSTISSIAILNKFDVKEVGALQDKMVSIGMNEGLKLLKAALQSKTVLTDVFLGKEATTKI
ncbi:hypothetical protein FEM48_Zijuj03G0076000 [Ziziphus jujuba var. spinosa]|uniref:Uncharacterized protein n=1 Tax=Ziziphus jujuba var. spinosa TaxID=714518 RepID=A0A978VP05_ZIZJJ|nr:nucleoporin NUP42-like isoform X1 [Ziziphus jujuba var. spinosa]KAH7537280.1 hypothetical protein FEM48_Zijuj03G0076000 [Ziziphus jujuba var. spinosa]